MYSMDKRPVIAAALLVAAGCGADSSDPERTARSQQAASANGSGGDMPAFYDGQLFTINFKELSVAEATLIKRNGQFNFIYQSDPGLPGGQPFISVIDAIPADGMNPLWLEVQITFNTGHTPRQLFSDDEIAAAAASGEITLTTTDEMYRCSVIGKVAPASGRVVGSSSGATASTGSTRSTSWGAIMKAYR